MAYVNSECPDQCNGKGQHRQMDVNPEMLSQFPAVAQAEISELGKPMRCTYCGCVYVGVQKIGKWNSGVLGPGWHSRLDPNAT